MFYSLVLRQIHLGYLSGMHEIAHGRRASNANHSGNKRICLNNSDECN